jgi:hypothetical protein
MDERLDHPGLRHRLEGGARLAQFDALALHGSDAETLPHERVDVDPAREHVAASRCRLDRDVTFARDGLDRFGGDQRERAPWRRGAVGPVVAVAFEAPAGTSVDPVDGLRQLAVLGAQEDRFDSATHRPDPIVRARRRPASRS